MKMTLLEKSFKMFFPKIVENTEDELHQIKEHTIDDSVLLLTFRLTQFLGLQPIIIKKIKSKRYHVSISPVIYLLNILTSLIINGIFLYALLLSIILPKDSPRGFIGYASFDETNDLLIAIAVIPLSVVSIFSTLYGGVRVRCILYCLERLEKIKQNIKKLPYEHVTNKRKKLCMILFVISWPFILEGTGTWISGFTGLGTWICHILTINVVLLEFQFLLLVESLNSSFQAINTQLNEVLSHLNFDYTKRARRTQIAHQIHHLMICFVQSCNMLRKINCNESFLLLCHVIIFPLHILIRLYYLFYEIFNTEDDPFQPLWIICEAVNCLYHVFKTIFIIQPCHQIQEEVDETKHLLAELMCHLQSEDDPLFESVDSFYKQLMLNNYTFTGMDICDIGRHLFSKIVALAITVVMVIKF